MAARSIRPLFDGDELITDPATESAVTSEALTDQVDS
jgi:hypothetical protein